MEKYVGVSAVLNSENQIEVCSEVKPRILIRNFDFDLEDNLLAGIYAFADEFYRNYKITYVRISSKNTMIAILERKDED